MRTAKTLIRLGGCPGWSESSLGAQSLCWFCHVAANFVHHKRSTDFWGFPFSGDLMLNKCHCFSWSVVESAFHLQHYCILGLSGNFRICQEEKRSRAAWNFIELCFLTFLSNKSKQLLIQGLIIFLFSEIITISILHCSGDKRLNLSGLKLDVRFCEIEEIFQAICFIWSDSFD